MFGVITIFLAFIGYVPYIRDTFLGKTRPHVVSWFLWTIVSFLAFGLQWGKGAGSGSYANFAMGLISLLLFFKSFKSGTRNIVTADVISFVMAIMAIFLWLVVDQPVLSIILVVLIDIFSFIPTFIKSWDKPWQETMFTWVLSIIRQFLVFCGELFYRRRVVARNN